MKHFFLRILKSKTVYFLIMIAALFLSSIKIIQPNLSNFSLTTPSGKIQKNDHPGFMQSTESGIYRLSGTLRMETLSSPMLRIIPDDEILSLTINNTPINLNNIPHHLRKDYNRGFTYDLRDHLNKGDNTIDIVYSDQGGLMGIVIGSEPEGTMLALMYLLCSLFAIMLSLKVLSIFRVSIPIKLLFIGALLIRIFYFSVTPADVRDHDLGDHIGYSEYLSTRWMPPPIDYATGGAFFHPPLYYYTGALVYRATQFFEPHNKVTIYRTQQILSLTYSMGFVLFGLLILNELLNKYHSNLNQTATTQNKQEKSTDNIYEQPSAITTTQSSLFWLIGALFAFWPVSIIHSVRIGNDPMLYFLFSASLYFIIRWYRTNQKNHLMLASILGAAAILTKANGEILVAVLGIIGLFKMIRSREWTHYIKMAIVPCLIMLIAVAITVGPGLILKLEGKRDKLYIDNIDGLSKANLVGNTASNYFWFDAKTFITEPYTDPYDDRMGRQFFWNYLGKTGLFGEFKYSSLLSTNMAVVCSFFAVFMLIYCIAGLYRMGRDDLKFMAPMLLSGFFLWAGVTYMRMTFPANIDFRYIVPILITFCGVYSASIISFERQGIKRMATIGKAGALAFTISSILFILGIS
jgi:hypothetical protein